jgi:hypothetical protein
MPHIRRRSRSEKCSGVLVSTQRSSAFLCGLCGYMALPHINRRVAEERRDSQRRFQKGHYQKGALLVELCMRVV